MKYIWDFIKVPINALNSAYQTLFGYQQYNQKNNQEPMFVDFYFVKCKPDDFIGWNLNNIRCFRAEEGNNAFIIYESIRFLRGESYTNRLKDIFNYKDEAIKYSGININSYVDVKIDNDMIISAGILMSVKEHKDDTSWNDFWYKPDNTLKDRISKFEWLKRSDPKFKGNMDFYFIDCELPESDEECDKLRCINIGEKEGRKSFIVYCAFKFMDNDFIIANTLKKIFKYKDSGEESCVKSYNDLEIRKRLLDNIEKYGYKEENSWDEFCKRNTPESYENGFYALSAGNIKEVYPSECMIMKASSFVCRRPLYIFFESIAKEQNKENLKKVSEILRKLKLCEQGYINVKKIDRRLECNLNKNKSIYDQIKSRESEILHSAVFWNERKWEILNKIQLTNDIISCLTDGDIEKIFAEVKSVEEGKHNIDFSLKTIKEILDNRFKESELPKRSNFPYFMLGGRFSIGNR